MANFRRKLDDLDLLEEIPGATRISGRNRPGQLYRVARRFKDTLSVRERGL
jgi:8-oxo-dGTP diphosphatase